MTAIARGKAVGVTPKPAMKLTWSLTKDSCATVMVGSAASYCLSAAAWPLVIGRTMTILNVSSARGTPISGAAAPGATAQAGEINVGKSFPPLKLQRRPLGVVLVFSGSAADQLPSQADELSLKISCCHSCHDLAKRNLSPSATDPTIRTLRTIAVMAV